MASIAPMDAPVKPKRTIRALWTVVPSHPTAMVPCICDRGLDHHARVCDLCHGREYVQVPTCPRCALPDQRKLYDALEADEMDLAEWDAVLEARKHCACRRFIVMEQQLAEHFKFWLADAIADLTFDAKAVEVLELLDPEAAADLRKRFSPKPLEGF